MAVKNITVALGGSEYMGIAMREACAMAKRHEGRLEGLVIRDTTLVDPVEAAPIGGGGSARELREAREEAVREGMDEAVRRFNAYCEKEGVKNSVVETEGDAVEILEEKLQLVDLAIFGIRHAFDYGAVLHPHDFLARVARAARRPILAMAEPTHVVNRVLVAYDGSRASADALRSFAILQAFEPEMVKVVSVGETDTEATRHVETARAYLEAHDYKTEGMVVEGDPAEQILAEAKSIDADLIVLGAVGRSGLAKLLMGDTASSILTDSTTSLFLRS